MGHILCFLEVNHLGQIWLAIESARDTTINNLTDYGKILTETTQQWTFAVLLKPSAAIPTPPIIQLLNIQKGIG